jgi:hypothetical protein
MIRGMNHLTVLTDAVDRTAARRCKNSLRTAKTTPGEHVAAVFARPHGAKVELDFDAAESA